MGLKLNNVEVDILGMQKILIVIVAVVVVLGGGYYFMYMSAPVNTPSQVQEKTSGNEEVAGGLEVGTKAEVATEAKVVLKGFAVSPNTIRVKVGAKVTWVNEDLAGHSVTSDTGAFGSKIISQGKTFEHTFTEKGSFSYHCEPHPSMKGTVIVE